ncbi:MAG: hypothetical protein IPL53_07060 [Ignavibacteria bacterium]|nr:hypothetical protein [Ignavibacteria bacterium]
MGIFYINSIKKIMRNSSKRVRFSVILLSLITIFAVNFANAQTAPSVSAIPNKKSYSPGESGVLTLTFKTGSKVKIPKDPEVTVNLSGDIEAGGLQDYSGGEGDYISGSKVKYNFTVPGNAASGSTITVSGSVKFGYCTVTDGVCKIGNKEFTAKIRVK